MEHLQEEYPDSRKGLFEEDGSLRPFVSVYVNDVRISEAVQWENFLYETDEILLLPAIAGGAPVESVISDERRKEVSLGDR